MTNELQRIPINPIKPIPTRKKGKWARALRHSLVEAFVYCNESNGVFR